MRLHVRATELFIHNLRTRMPFRYGIATMTRVPHVILRLTLEIDGRVQHGFAADHLPPKWFTKNPETPFREDVADMLEVIRHGCVAAEMVGSAESVFAWWRECYTAQKTWASARGFPPLLWGFGVAFVERAVIDAFCRAERTTFAHAVRDDFFGIRLGAIYPELAGFHPGDFLPARPLEHVIVRHTVGLADPLTDDEIPAIERVRDGLPESLAGNLRANGITHLKIKLGGDPELDRDRLRRIVKVLDREAAPCAFTLDGNENYKAVAPFRQLWESFLAEATIARFLEHLIFVEQPVHRDAALTPETAAELLAWPERPPIIIDESDAEVGTLATALASGYAGTSHKNCKGVFKGLANACLIAHRCQHDATAQLHMSAEDLSNVGPLALLQDLAVVASLGIPHAERNGHHYFAGLSQFPVEVQRAVLAAHSDLYTPHAGGFPVVHVQGGTIAVRSVVAAPFGLSPALDLSPFTPADQWQFDSLEV